MKFPNAYNGSKKLFIAELISLIAAILLIVGAFVALGSIKTVDENTIDAAVGGVLGGAGIMLAAGIAAVVAFIIQLVGINACAKDEPTFKSALYAILAGIVASIASSAVSGKSAMLGSIFSAVSSLASMIAIVFVIKGFMKLADQLGRSDVSSSGKTVMYATIGLLAVSIILTFVSGLITPAEIKTAADESSAKTGEIISLIASALSIIQSIIYLIFLKKSKDMLAE